MNFYARIGTFLIGVILGIYLAKIASNDLAQKKHSSTQNTNLLSSKRYHKWIEKLHIKRTELAWDTLRYDNSSDTLESDFLYHRVPVLCVILVKRPNNAEAAQNTWARSCNKVQLVHLPESNTNKMPRKRNRSESSWVLLCRALFEVLQEFHWVLVVHDYTYAIVENLRHFVAPLNAHHDFYLGHASTLWGHDYNSNEAGYVISAGALRKLQRRLRSQDSCMGNLTYWNKEDFYLGKHFAQLNITPTDTRDDEGLSTFHPYNWYHAFYPGEGYYKGSKFPVKCCSRSSVTFQAIEGDKMYSYYYLLYTLQLFNSGRRGNALPPPHPKDEVWRSFLRDRNVMKENVSPQEYYRIWEDLIDDPNSFARNMKREEHSEL